MSPENDQIYVIEGTDGSGKTAHVQLLKEWLESLGMRVAVFDFPRYEKESSLLVREYLKGTFGARASDIDPIVASHFYAFDRLAASSAIRAALAEGKVVVLNRYVGSNLAHQGGKYPSAAARRKFYASMQAFEYEVLGIPRPTMTVVLRMPTEQAQQFVDQKAARGHLDGKKRDLHEGDLNHLMSAAEAYAEICALYPEEYKLVECVRDERLLSILEIFELIKAMLAPFVEPSGEVTS